MKHLLRTAAFVAGLSALAAPTASAENTAVWKISDDDSTVYLAGSVHLLREEDLPTPPVFDRVYQEAEEIVFEVDMAKMLDPAMAMKIREMGTLPKGEELSDHLELETLEKFKAYLAKSGLPYAAFQNFSPGMAYLTIASLEAIKMGARPDLGMETQFFAKAQKDEKPSRGLETAEFQISRFNEFTDEEMNFAMSHALDNIDESADSLDAIIKTWKLGNMEALEALLVEQLAPTPRIKELLLDSRNENWIPEIEKSLAESHDVMFLVGAAHLVGEGSVVDLLREKGYGVTQLSKQ